MTDTTWTWADTRRPFFDWLGHALGCAADEIEAIWRDGQSHDTFDPFERDSVMVALEMLGPVDRAAFCGDMPWDRLPVTFRDIATGHDTTMRCALFGTYNIVRADNGTPVMVWMLDGNIDIDVIVTSPDVEAREQVLQRIRHLAEGVASTWRGKRVLFDLSQASWYRHLEPAARPAIVPDETVVDELRRNVIVPIRHFGLDDRIAERRGVLLHGRPGTGKTQALTWVQAELAELDRPVTVIVTTPKMFSNANVIKDLFLMVAAAPPCLLVMEDIDLTLTSREWGPMGNDALGELLQFMDGPAQVRGGFVAATTNHPGVLDAALIRRPGRFDRKIEVADASAEARRLMIEMLLARIGDESSSTDALVDRTDGWSLAELDEAAHLAVLTSLDTGDDVDLTAALEQVHRTEQGTTAASASSKRTTGYV